MKIQTTSPLRANSLRRSDRSRPGGSGFADVLSGDAAPSGALGGGAQIHGLNGLLTIQEVEDDAPDKRRAVARAEDLLDQLDALRDALLTGRVPREQIERLMGRLKEQGQGATDPRLAEAIAEIELRAAVELAKLER